MIEDVGVDVVIKLSFDFDVWLSWPCLTPDDIFLVFMAGEFSGDESGGDVVGGVGGSPLSL